MKSCPRSSGTTSSRLSSGTRSAFKARTAGKLCAQRDLCGPRGCSRAFTGRVPPRVRDPYGAGNPRQRLDTFESSVNGEIHKALQPTVIFCQDPSIEGDHDSIPLAPIDSGGIRNVRGE
jgi:hypothetical protein